MPAPLTHRSLALADTSTNEVVEIVDIVFDSFRALCSARGIVPGTIVRCDGRTVFELSLRAEDGARVQIDPFYACFVNVRPAPWRSSRRPT